MAQTIIIEQGDKDLQDVTKVTPDTRVNQKATIKYPVTDLNNGMQSESWTDEDEVTFTNPHIIENDSSDTDDSSDTSESESNSEG